MLPAPAAMAATPATRRSVSWNPAVPPPPVTGAAVGTGVAVEVAVAVTVGVAVCVTVCVACGVTVEGVLELALGVPEAEVRLLPSEGEVPELPAEAETDTEPLTDTVGEKLGMVGAVDDDEVHAASATGAIRVSAPQHSAVS